MAKRKKQSKRPQAQHKPKSRSSQHDKRKRLDTPNPQRKKTAKAKVPLTGKMADLMTSKARACITIQRRVRQMTNGCTGTPGWRCVSWRRIRCGE